MSPVAITPVLHIGLVGVPNAVLRESVSSPGLMLILTACACPVQGPPRLCFTGKVLLYVD